MRVLITGATGFVGSAMRETVPIGIDPILVGFTRSGGPVARLDVTSPRAVTGVFASARPAAVVHLAAVSTLDQAAADVDAAIAVNVEGARTVAQAAAGNSARLVALSSDVVFDGRSAPYGEDSEPNPINPYGEGKLLGEQSILAAHPEALIIRTSTLVGRDRSGRTPFSRFVLDQAQAGRPVDLFEDERRNFFPVTIAAQAVWECVGLATTGYLHVATLSSSSRYEFGRALIEAAGLDPQLARPVTGPPERPSDLTLDVSRAAGLLETRLPTTEEALIETLRDIGIEQ